MGQTVGPSNNDQNCNNIKYKMYPIIYFLKSKNMNDKHQIKLRKYAFKDTRSFKEQYFIHVYRVP
jgi:hypothetical protein